MKHTAKDTHTRRWGALYLLAALFLASWLGQALTMAGELDFTLSRTLQSADFWAATFENWQSEWAQLAVQAGVVVALAHKLFRKSIEDTEEIKGMLRELLERGRG